MNTTVILSIVIVFFFSVIYLSEGKISKPHDQWWGPEILKLGNDTSIRPFKIQFSDEMISDLLYRLENYRPAKPTLPDVGFEYGFNTREVPRWIDYWAHQYPFKERERYLNQYPQYKTNIQGLDLHFIRVAPEVPPGVEVVPLLLLHGWPGSVREFYDTIPYLTEVSSNRDFAVEVIAPSLPGFGYSDAASRPGLSSDRMAVVLRNLMHRLGHKKFVVQGGDWGAIVGSDITTLFPNEVIGYHTNLAIVTTVKGLTLQVVGAVYPPLVVNPALANRMYPLLKHGLWLLRETGYLHEQATKPDTLGIGLSDSPVGQLAFLFQSISTGTRRYYTSKEDGGLSHYPPETLLDNLMFYWVPNSISTSFRIYTETLNKQFTNRYRDTPTKVPTWVLQAKHEIAYQSPAILKTKYPNLLQATVLDDGGHFFAMEMPKFFAHDVLNAVDAFRKWHRKHLY